MIRQPLPIMYTVNIRDAERVHVTPGQASAAGCEFIGRLGYDGREQGLIADHLLDAALCGHEDSGPSKILDLAHAPKAKLARNPAQKAHEQGFGVVGVGNSRMSEGSAYFAQRIARTRRPNVVVKLGAMIGRLWGFPFIDHALPPLSDELAQAWKPYIETCIEAFGPQRSMFESNFPPEKAGCSARVLWNTFKRITAGCSKEERSQMFAGTATRVYRLPEQFAKPL